MSPREAPTGDGEDRQPLTGGLSDLESSSSDAPAATRRRGLLRTAAVATGALAAASALAGLGWRRRFSGPRRSHETGVVSLDVAEDGTNCEDATVGAGACFEDVTWAMQEGIWEHASWYEGLSPQSGFLEFQTFLAEKGLGHCLPPCQSYSGHVHESTASSTQPAVAAEDSTQESSSTSSSAAEEAPTEAPTEAPSTEAPSPASGAIHYAGDESSTTAGPPQPTTVTTTALQLRVHAQLLTTTTVTMKVYNKEQQCGEPQPGEQCWVYVNWALQKGISKYPDRYSGLTTDSSFQEVQKFIHESGKGNCPKPCADGETVDSSAVPKGECRDPDAGDQCYTYVTWAMQEGIHEHPEWYDGLTQDSSFKEFQQMLHNNGHGGCARPCGLDGSTTAEAPTQTVKGHKAIKTTTTLKSQCKPDHPTTLPSLFCFSVMQVDGMERDLVQSQYDKGASIFACNEFAVISAKKLSMGKDNCGSDVWTWVNDLPSVPMGDLGRQGVTTSSFLNTQTFLMAWDTLMNSGKIWSHDWVVKVDPDAVFYPDRLRKHIKDHTGKQAYVLNCNWGGEPKIFGSIEVFTSQALKAYQDDSLKCKELPWQGWGEDMYMQECMALLGAEAIEDYDLVGDARCKDAPCSDEWHAAFHPFKEPGQYWDCYSQR